MTAIQPIIAKYLTDKHMTVSGGDYHAAQIENDLLTAGFSVIKIATGGESAYAHGGNFPSTRHQPRSIPHVIHRYVMSSENLVFHGHVTVNIDDGDGMETQTEFDYETDSITLMVERIRADYSGVTSLVITC